MEVRVATENGEELARGHQPHGDGALDLVGGDDIDAALEGISGAVLAKIAVLVFIIIFIQKRPQGMFALKGRFADA